MICWFCVDINAAPQLRLKEQVPPEKLNMLAIDKPVRPRKIDFGDGIIIGEKYDNQIDLTSLENQREKGRPRLYPLFPDVNSQDHIFYSLSDENNKIDDNPMPMYMPLKNVNVKIAAKGK